MKIRQGFVSNSSSSSFIVNKKYLSPFQIEQIKNHLEEGKKYNMDTHHGYQCGEYDAWRVVETEKEIRCDTILDNFDMEHFLREIGVPMDKVGWGGFDLDGWDPDEAKWV